MKKISMQNAEMGGLDSIRFYQDAIKAYMYEHKLNQEEMARKLEVTPPTLSNWLSGTHGLTRKSQMKVQHVCADVIPKLAQAAFEHEAQKSNSRAAEIQKQVADEAVPVREAGVRFREFPVLSIAQAAGYEPALEPLCDYLRETSDRTALFFDVSADNCFALEISGDSMAPDYPNGSIALVAAGEYPQRGDVVAAKLADGQVVIKEYHRKNNIISLESINPDGKNFEWHCKEDSGFVQWMWPVIEVTLKMRDQRWARRKNGGK